MLLAAALVADARASDFAVLPTRAAPPPAGPPVVNAVPYQAAPQPTYAAPPPALNAPLAPADGSPLAAGPAVDAPSTGHFYADFEYLWAFLQPGTVPPLVTTTTSGLPRGQAGVVGIPGNQTLFGGGISNEPHAGGLLRVGYQLDGKGRQGFEVGVLVIGREGDTFTAGSNAAGLPVLARPFFNTQTGTGDAELVAFPGVLAGSVRVRTASDLVGTEVNYRAAVESLCCDGCGCGCDGGGRGWGPSWCQVDYLAGVRTARYRDKVVVDTLRNNLDPANPASNRPVVEDGFFAKTLFVGVQFGLDGRVEWNNLFLEGRGTAALGQSSSRVDVNGFSDVVANGVVQRQRVGLLTGRTNIGFYGDQDTGFLSELSLRAGYKFGSHLSVTVGYTALYLSSVMRAGGVIDPVVNTTQIPPATLTGPTRPQVILQNEDVWAHAVTLGVEWRY
jgi:hypothetical protein